MKTSPAPYVTDYAARDASVARYVAWLNAAQLRLRDRPMPTLPFSTVSRREAKFKTFTDRD